ncbi:hypothetical protein GCM10027321_26650 [Massilia terrae]|uniref:Kelch motif-containing protein n=1 Tax=Massilia terrae TaxID=1811224 RepID=A0ABT2CYY5_9BURK|nr:kelch repeat-containing protein [Massilia terrae]MCS0659187.1 kelch motif-containing protein [Massilia terrae]
MKRRTLLLGAAGLPACLTACGGGGASSSPSPNPVAAKIDSVVMDKPGYFVGDSANITVRFTGTSARLEPGAIAVTNSADVTIGPLTKASTYKLIVTSGTVEVKQDILVPVAYRHTFTTLSMGVARAMHQAVLLADGRVLLIGGEGNGVASPASVIAFNWQTRAFSSIGELSTGRTEHTATVLGDGTVLVVGGSRSTSGTPLAERFDPRTGTSRATAGQPIDNRWQHSATLLPDGKVLIAGGRTSGANANSDTMDLFDPATDQFTRLPARLAFKRYGHVAVKVTDSAVMLYGGATTGGGNAPPEQYDIPGRSAAALAPRASDPATRMNPALVKLADSDYLVAGGALLPNFSALASVTAIAVGGIAINALAPMTVARSGLAGATLADGRALLTGGAIDDPSGDPAKPQVALASTELVALMPNSVQAGPPMAVARYNHTATALPNGMVLVAGGHGADGLALASAELYS